MAPTWLKPGAPYVFSTKWGFTGSARGDVDPKNRPNATQADDDEFGDGTYVAKMAKGGAVKAPLRGKTRNDLSTQDAANFAGFTPFTEDMSEAASAPPAQGHAKGGRIKKAFGGGMPGRPANAPIPQGQPAGALSHATISMPVGDAAQAVKKTFGAGRAVGLAQAAQRGRGMAPMGPPGAATALGAAPPPAPMQTGVPAMKRGGRAKFDMGGMVTQADANGGTVNASQDVTNEPGFGMAKGGHWIKDMHMKKGALRASLHVPEGKPIPAAKLTKAAHSDNPTMRRRAQLAETFKGFNHGKG